MKRVLLVAGIACLLLGCNSFDSVKEGYQHTTAIAAQLQDSTGVEAAVGFNWHNGALTEVSVTFSGLPDGLTLEEIAELAQAAVRDEFEQRPKRILVAFAIAG